MEHDALFIQEELNIQELNHSSSTFKDNFNYSIVMNFSYSIKLRLALIIL